MKVFKKRTSEIGMGTMDVLTRVIQAPSLSKQGMNVVEMRERIKILDALEKDTEIVELDDKLHSSLCNMINEFSFGTANRDLLGVLEDVLQATESLAGTNAKMN